MNLQRIGRYQVVHILGQGAMGIVYQGRDPHLARTVAIKTIQTTGADRELAKELERRFLTEARSVARLQHPGIVSLYDAGIDGSTSFLVMEFVGGINLQTCVSRNIRFTLRGAIHIVVHILAALEHAHQHRIVHRDIKPGNILLDAAGVIKLADFGIAKIQEAGADNRTQLLGLKIGTPRYMSPEQVCGVEVDARSDLYSTAVLLYELLTASVPFAQPDTDSLFKAIQFQPPPAPSSRIAVPAALDAIVLKGLAKRLHDRYQSAAEFAADLRSLDLSDFEDLGFPAHPTATDLVQPDSRVLLSYLLESEHQQREEAAAALPLATAAPAAAQTATAPQPTPVDAGVDPTRHRAATALRSRGVLLWAGVPILSAALLWAAIVSWQSPAPPIPAASRPAPASTVGAQSSSAAQPTASVPVRSEVASGPVRPPESERPPQSEPATEPVVAQPAPERAAASPPEPGSRRAPLTGTDASRRSSGVQTSRPSRRCSLLLEKAGSGEPLSPEDRAELTSSCR